MSTLNALLAKIRDPQSNLIRTSLGSLILKVSSILLTFSITVALARILGPEKYGVYVYVYNLIALLSVPAEFGLPTLVIRETAKALATDEWGHIRGVWSWAGKVIGILTAILILGAAVGILFFGNRFDHQYLVTFSWGLLLVPLVALGELRGAALQGLNRVIQGQLPEEILLPSTFLLLILGSAFVLQVDDMGPAFVISLQVAAAALTFLIGAWLLLRATPSMVLQAKSAFYNRQWLISTLPLAFISGMQLINNSTSILVLGFFVDSAQAGVYRIASQISVLVALGLQVMNVVMAPEFASTHAVGKRGRLQHLATVSARGALAITLPIVIIILVFGRLFLKLVFGVEYVPAYEPLTIMAVGQLVNSISGSSGFLLNMTGHERDTARGVVVAAICNIILNLILVPHWGLMGAALASTSAMTIWNVLLWIDVRRKLRINSMAFRIFDFADTTDPEPSQG